MLEDPSSSDNAQSFAKKKERSNRMVLRLDDGNVADDALYGEVISITGRDIIVEYEDTSGAIKRKKCIITGKVISKNQYSNLVAAGDNVYFSNEGKILKIDVRASKLSRKDPSNRNREQIIAANCDTLVIFASIVSPYINFRLIDRYIIAAKLGHLEPIICINKIDLIERKIIKEIRADYERVGIKTFVISVLEEYGLKSVFKELKKRKSVISGPSGVGKSSFINKLFGEELQMVSEINERTDKGTHTTTFSVKYSLGSNFWIIDTPGIREFDLWDISKEELPVMFPDFLGYYQKCKYTSCTHTHEPQCAVRDALDDGEITEERYSNYLSIFETLED